MIDPIASKIWLSTFVDGLLHGWSAEVDHIPWEHHHYMSVWHIKSSTTERCVGTVQQSWADSLLTPFDGDDVMVVNTSDPDGLQIPDFCDCIVCTNVCIAIASHSIK